MATTYPVLGTTTPLTVTGLGTLASANYATSDIIDLSAGALPYDVEVEVTAATTNTPAANKQLVVYAVASLDGTNFSSGNTSVTDTNHDGSMYYVGVLPVPVASTTERKTFSIAAAMPGGVVLPKLKIIIRNDLGVALTSASVQYRTVALTVA